MPPDRNARFIGREAELKELRNRFRTEHRVALTGPPGVGKTQLALEHLHRQRARYPKGVFWLHGDRRATLNRDLAALAGLLQLPERDLKDQEQTLAAVARWLRQESAWLMVVDNLEDPGDLERLLPRGLGGDLLVTSRHPIWGGGQVVRPLPPELAARFLLLRTGQRDQAAAVELADELGCLPLALEQAGAYMTETGETLAGYLAILRQRPAALLQSGTPSDYPQTVVNTLSVSVQQVQRSSRVAADLLCLCAFLAPDDIPVRLLADGASELDGPLRDVAADPIRLNQAISVLLGYSVLSRHGDALSAHRLVQAVVREAVLGSRAGRWGQAAVPVVGAAFPVDAGEEDRWPECAGLLPQALAVCNHPVTRGLPGAEALRTRVGAYLVARAAVVGDVDGGMFGPETASVNGPTSESAKATRLHATRARGVAGRRFPALPRTWMVALAGLVIGVVAFTTFAQRGPIHVTFAEFRIPPADSSPLGLTVGPDHKLWFTEYGAGKIGRIDMTGRVAEFPLPTPDSFPQGIVAGPDGNLWFTENTANKIGVITTAGRVIKEIPLPRANSRPVGIALGPDGNLWFNEQAGNKVGRITLQDAIDEFNVPTRDSGPESISVGPDNNLWFTEDAAHKIGRITTKGVITEFDQPGNGGASYGMTAGPDGCLWFTEERANQIGRITTSGAVSEFHVDTAGSQPIGITVGPDGHVWFAELAGDKIGRADTGGVMDEHDLPSAASVPMEIVTGPDRNLWLTEAAANKVARVQIERVTPWAR